LSELLLGWPNGVLGMLFGTLAGLLIIWQTWRSSPWDIHDEDSYKEPSRLTIGVMAPSLVLFGVLLTLMLGVGALDRTIWPPFAIAGDILGLIILPFAAHHVFFRKRDADRKPSDEATGAPGITAEH
jgi:hypothetical protein